jgi:uncharacterized SAM-binding protein YcdF (DUF218 family)
MLEVTAGFSTMLKKIIVYLFFPTFLLILSAYYFFLHIGDWLTPVDIQKKAEVVVCLAERNSRMDKAISLLQRGLAGKIVVTTDATYQDMLYKKVSPDKILKADWSAESTYEEGLLLKDILDEKIQSVIVVTDPFHLYRAKWTFRHIFSNKYTVFSFISSDEPSLQGFWWSNPNSRLFVLSELPKIVYYWIWHGLLGVVEDPQWALDFERVYMTFIKDVFIRRMV